MTRPGYAHVAQADYEAVAGPDWPTWHSWCSNSEVADTVLAEVEAHLVRPVQFDHPSFCVLPFYAREWWLGSTQDNRETFCCLVPDGTDRRRTQQAMLRGQKPESCAACWRLEHAGLVSDRQIKNRAMDHAMLADIQGMLAGQAQTLPIQHYKIDTNNTCNGTCVVCDSTYSSAWAQLQRRNGMTPDKSWSIAPRALEHDIDYVTARSMGFRGGEPMLSEQVWQILERLVRAGNTHCDINFTTNGSVTLTDRQQRLLEEFSSVGFHFSIDGVGPVFEYVRYPLKWSDLETNLKFVQDRGWAVTASYTITNMNILYHAQTRAWFEEHGISWTLNPVSHPAHFRPGALPWHAKQHILEGADEIVQGLIGQHEPQDDIDYLAFRERRSQQDSWKGISMEDYLPELCQLLG